MDGKGSGDDEDKLICEMDESKGNWFGRGGQSESKSWCCKSGDGDAYRNKQFVIFYSSWLIVPSI